MILGEREGRGVCLGGVKGRESMVRMYCIRKKKKKREPELHVFVIFLSWHHLKILLCGMYVSTAGEGQGQRTMSASAVAPHLLRGRVCCCSPLHLPG